MSRRGAVWAGWIGASALSCGVAAVVAPSLALPVLVGFVLAFAAVCAEILAVSRVAPVLSWRQLTVLSIGLGLGLVALVGVRARPETVAMETALLLGLATALGAKLGHRIEQPGHLLAVFLVSSLADLWSVYDGSGPSAQLAQRVAERPEELTVFALSWPLLGTRHLPPIIGAGDVLFAALYLSAFDRHGLSQRRALVALALGFALGLVVLITIERAVPLLPWLGAAVVAAEPRARSLAPRERRSVWVASVVLAVAILVRVLR